MVDALHKQVSVNMGVFSLSRHLFNNFLENYFIFCPGKVKQAAFSFVCTENVQLKGAKCLFTFLKYSLCTHTSAALNSVFICLYLRKRSFYFIVYLGKRVNWFVLNMKTRLK